MAATRSRLRAPWAIVLGLTLLALALRIGPLRQSIWGDELFLFRIINDHGPRTILDLVGAEEKTPPLGFLLTRIFSGVGDGTVWSRMPSLLAGLATVSLVFVLGRRVAGTAAGLVGAAWIALSPFEIFYATESRAYALVQCACVASTLALLVAVERRGWRWWALAAVTAAIAVYAHYIAVLVLAPQVLWALWRVRADREQLVRLVAAQVAVVVLFLPWVPDFLEQARNSSKEAGFVNGYAPNDWPTVRQLIGHSFAGHPFLGMQVVPGTFATGLLLTALAVGAVAALARWRKRRTRPSLATERGLMTVLAVAPLVGLFAYSALPDTSFLLARNMSVLVPYGVLAVAAVLMALRPRPLAIGTSAALLVAVAIGAVAVLQPDQRKPDTRAAAAYIERIAPPGAVLINGSFLFAPNGPPSKAVLTYLHRPFTYAPADPSDRSSYVYFPGTQIPQGYETARRQHRPIVLLTPGGKRVLDFLNLPAIYQPYFRLAGQQLTRGLAGGFGVRVWLPR